MGAMKRSRKGNSGFEITVTGRASHVGGQPGKGANAIVEMAQQVVRLH